MARFRTDYEFKDGSGQRAILHFVPEDPDSTRAYAKFAFKGPGGSGVGQPRQKGSSVLQKLLQSFVNRIAGSGLAHAMGHGLVDQVWKGKEYYIQDQPLGLKRIWSPPLML